MAAPDGSTGRRRPARRRAAGYNQGSWLQWLARVRRCGPTGRTAMATTERLMTADELLNLPDDGQRHELIAGELRTTAPNGGQHGRVTMRLSTPLDHHVMTYGLGWVFTAGTGFLLQTQPDTVRAPDV